MENPALEIESVVKLFTTSVTPEVQRAAIEKYFAPDAGFNHPLCKVDRSPNSRNKILGLYQWYRNMSPHVDLTVDNTTFDEGKLKAFVNVSHNFHIFVSPFQRTIGRLLVQLTLSQDSTDGLYYIIQQDDYYQPEELVYLVIPPLTPVVSFLKDVAAIASNYCTFMFQVLGYWRPQRTTGTERAKTT